MFLSFRISGGLLAVAALSLAGCTRLLGDFSYDPNGDTRGTTGGSSGVVQGDIVITPPSGLVTSEQGARATFTVVLKRKPTAPVTVGLTSSNEAEGKVSPSMLSFTDLNYGAPQMVQVTGVDDNATDGPQVYTIRTAPAVSDDASFRGFDALDAEVTNIDDDTAGFTLMPPVGLITSESGSEATFTIQLNHAPTADVTLPLSSDNEKEGKVSPASLTFTPLDWMAPQVVTVTGVDDDAKDGEQKFKVVTGAATSADSNYNNLNPPDQVVTNRDNETAGVILDPATDLFTNENGAMTSLGISLSSRPSGDVTIGLISSNPAEGIVSPESVTFTQLNWMAPQVVSVTGVNDSVVDGNQPFLVLTSIISSADSNYSALTAYTAEVINIDDDSPGFTVTPTQGLMTREDLTSASFTVVLNSMPVGNVVFDVVSSRPKEGMPAPQSLLFTGTNWNAPQSVNVMGVDDQVADGAQAYQVRVSPNASTADSLYAALLGQDVALINTDNDSAGITVGPQRDLTTTEAGGTATFSVKLNSQPKANVSIDLSSSNTAEGTVSPTQLVFTPSNYGSPQMVTVRGVDDPMQDGKQPYRIVTQNAVSDDPGYNGRDVPNVEVQNTDDDTAGITVDPTDRVLYTHEDGRTDFFSVKLNTRPSADVTFSLSSSNLAEGLASPTMLRFTATNWNAPQTVTVKGQNDDVDDGPQAYRISFSTIMSGDPNYAGDRLKPLDVKVTNGDGDTAGIGVRNITALTTTEKNSGTATFQVKLDTQPTADVSIGLSSSRTGEGTVSPAALTFTRTNWAAWQTVTVTGVDDKVQDGNQDYLIILAPATSTDGRYAGKVPPTPNVIVTNIDDDSAGVQVTVPPMLATSEPNGTATFTVQLNSQPTADVKIPLSVNKPSEASISPSSLTFTTLNWNAPRIVTLTGVDDKVQDGNQSYVVSLGAAMSTDAGYNAKFARDLLATNNDNDTAKVLVGAISGNTTEKNGGMASFAISLQTQPTADVTIGVSSSNKAEGTVNPASVKFTPINWASPQTITVTGVDDQVQDGAQPYWIDVAPATSADPNYQGLDGPDVMLSNEDNDTANITVSKISGDTSEDGSSATFSVVLDTQPTASVTLSIASNNAGEGTVSDASLTFTMADWASPKTVTVKGTEDDGAADGTQIYGIVFGAAKSGDKNYDGKQPASLSVKNIDNDSAGITVTAVPGGKTGEDGTQYSFTVVLNSKPKASVQIPVSSSDTLEGTVNTSQLTFTTANWAAKQTVTVTGVNDDEVDGAAVYTIVLGTPMSTDQAYADINPSDVTVTNIDNDTAGINVVADPDGKTSESGGQFSFTVVLNSKPKANVQISVSSSDELEGKVNSSQLTFTTTNWAAKQTVTVTGVNDDEADGSAVYYVQLGAPTSTDQNYAQLPPPANVKVTNVDNDTAGFVVGPPAGSTTEAGGTTTFSIKLTSKPKANVTVPLSSSNVDEGSLKVNQVVFTPSDWDMPHPITVYGEDDAVQDGAQSYQIITGASSSSDSNYNMKTVDDVSLSNEDNDSAGYDVSVPSGHTNEDGGTATFTVVLNSQPSAPVSIPVSSDNSDEGLPNKAMLIFSMVNWNQPQTVTVTGINDNVIDGAIDYKIVLGKPTSTDANYSSKDPPDVDFTNDDNDSASLKVSMPTSTTTGEDASSPSVTFSVVLTSKPKGNVVIPLASSNESEGIISSPASASLTFNAANWNVAQFVTVQGVDDALVDGDQMYTITIGPLQTTDPDYSVLGSQDVNLLNVDDEPPP